MGRAEPDTSTTAHTGSQTIVGHKVIKLMVDSLPITAGFILSGIMSACLPGEEREHTGVPTANPTALPSSTFIGDIKTVAGGT